MNIIAIPSLSDNYIWMLHNGQQAIVVDPGIALPVITALENNGLQLAAILITHGHEDHIGGVEALRGHLHGMPGVVFGPINEGVAEPFTALGGNRTLNILGIQINVLDVPGHTKGHLAYYIPLQAMADGTMLGPVLFCGDTLFSAGCGRLFGGTPAQMLASLDLLSGLPPETKVYCAHEYTLSNLGFAHAVEPGNMDIMAYTAHCHAVRNKGLATIPSTIAQELQVNPFLRTRLPQVIEAIRAKDPLVKNEVEIFAALRHWKDTY